MRYSAMLWGLLLFCVPWMQAQETARPATEILAKTADATAVILSGEGGGRLGWVSTAVIVRSDGVLLTSYHSIRDAHEVQVRLKSGETFDRAILLDADERRDVAALKISAVNLPFLPLGAGLSLKPGEPVFAVTTANGLAWSATQGIVSAVRPADEFPGAGQGYRVIQFTAPVAPGSSGGPLVDGAGRLAGIITRGGGTGVAFAVPVESVAGLADGTRNTQLGNGAALQMPNTPSASPASQAVAAADPIQLIRAAKTMTVGSRTMYFTPDTLEREFIKLPEGAKLGLVFVQDDRVADLSIIIDRPVFTYTFTYAVTDKKTSIVLQTGKVTAFDGNAAAPKIAKALAVWLSKNRK